MEYGYTVYLALLAWVPLVVLIFALLPPRRAVIASFAIAWMFLPVAEIGIRGLPDYTKMSATCIGVLIAAMLYDHENLTRFRLHAWDIPMAVFCLSPFLASVSNGLGVYDGLSASFQQTITWGFPYLIGRSLLNDRAGVRELAFGIFLGGLIYIPFCLYELRMSPQLHRMVYGYHAHTFAQTIRYGGYRPTVFMEHGLEVGMWMATASAFGVWLYVCGVLTPYLDAVLRGFRFRDGRPDFASNEGAGMCLALVFVLLVVTVFVKSTGAIALLILGLGALVSAAKLRNAIPVIFLIMIPFFYVGARSTGAWDGRNLVSLITRMNPERAQSLEFRFINEDMLARKALLRPLFGWGGWGRSRVYNPEGVDVSITDGLWIIIFGSTGWLGVFSFIATFVLPLFLLWRRFPLRTWATPEVGPLAVVTVWLCIYMIDCLLNAMVNPVFALALGAVVGNAVSEYPPGEAEPVADEPADAETVAQAEARPRITAV